MNHQTSCARNPRRCASALLMALLTVLGACQTRPEIAYDVAQPRTPVVRNIGNFNEALRCMDDMFIAQGKQDIYITTAGIPDATGLIAAGTKEMFITAVSRMSAKSNAFHFVDYDPTQLDVQVLSEMVGLHKEFVAPNYYVRGAITQLDSNVLQSSASAGVSIPGLDAAINANQIVSVVSIDLNMGKLVTRQIMPGISASNSIAVVQSGKGADVGGLIGKAGLSLSVSVDKSEGFHQAVRSLIELSTIEILGKLTRVPYWQCLSIESTNPNFRSEARGWFDTMGERERSHFVSAALVRTGYLQGDDDAASVGFSDAVARYQVDNDLVPNGRIDFDLYYRLLAADARRPAAKPVTAVPVNEATTAPAVGAPSPLRLVVDSPRGPKPTYRIGDTMVIAVQPNRDAFVYCFYQDAKGTVSRIFPNRFQPDPFLHANARIEIPSAGQESFAIRFDKPGGMEAIACLGSDHEIGLNLPDRLKAQDLEPLPISGLDDVTAQFRSIPGAQINEARLTVEVIR
jgi:curli biogenesis system outer membrane secretion channel CsgG